MSEKRMPGWEAHERHVNEALGLEATVASGNKWWDISDGVSAGSVFDNDVQLMVDAKSTLRKSFSVNCEYMRRYIEKATLRGKTFLLPVRFEDEDTGAVDDYVVLRLEDLLHLSGIGDRLEKEADSRVAKERCRAIMDLSDDVLGVLYDSLSETDSWKRKVLMAIFLIESELNGKNDAG